MSKKNGKTSQSTEALIQTGLTHAHARVEDTLNDLLSEKKLLELAVEGLLEGLQAYRSFAVGEGQSQTEPDFATRLKTQQVILSYRVGEPVKRQQILTGKMPEHDVDVTELRQTIAKKLAARVNSPDVTVAELVAAGKSLAEADKDAPLTPMSEAEAVTEARRIHGMATEEAKVTAPSPPVQNGNGKH